MKFAKVMLGSLMLAAAPLAAMAEDMSYNYVDLAYVDQDIDGVGPSADGFGLRGDGFTGRVRLGKNERGLVHDL